MKTSGMCNGLLWHIGVLAFVTIFVLSGCATKDYIGKQINPLSDRVTQNENRIGQTEGHINILGERVTAGEVKINNIEGGLGKVDAKAEQVLAILGNLRLERHLVIDMKEGVNFGFNSAALPDDAKQKIDEFLSDSKGDLAGMQNAVFLIAGHTDNTGPEDFNYELGNRRAETVRRYLVTQKKIDPLHVVAVSYGENSPISENNTRDGRAKNRRVEILVYSEIINSNIAATQVHK